MCQIYYDDDDACGEGGGDNGEGGRGFPFVF